MEIRFDPRGEEVYAFICGEVDHHNAREAREQLDRIIDSERPMKFALDLSGVTFCDSSGLGLVMGRMRKCLSVGSTMVIQNPSNAAYKILEIAGMEKIIKIERTIKNG